MKPLPFRMLLLCACMFAARSSDAQTPATSAAPKYRCSRHLSTHIADSASYRSLKAVDYTPPNDLQRWSVAKELQSYAATVNGELTLECVLSIDEKGIIRNVKIAKSGPEAAKIKKLLAGARTAGPSYVHNKAVSCFVPCIILIKDHQVTIS